MVWVAFTLKNKGKNKKIKKMQIRYKVKEKSTDIDSVREKQHEVAVGRSQ